MSEQIVIVIIQTCTIFTGIFLKEFLLIFQKKKKEKIIDDAFGNFIEEIKPIIEEGKTTREKQTQRLFSIIKKYDENINILIERAKLQQQYIEALEKKMGEY